VRSRSLKPAIFKNELLGSADPLVTILFEGLWCCADREGRLEDRPLRICAEVFPYRRSVTEKKVDTWLDWLHGHGFIVRYEAGPKKAIQVVNFLKHQRPHSKEAPSIIQPLDDVRHRPRKVLAPTKVRPEPGKGSGEHALTPDSGLLTPDSSLRADARAEEIEPQDPAPGRNGDAWSDLQLMDAFAVVRSTYPHKTGHPPNWIQAEHHWRQRVEEGVPLEQLLDGVERYAAYVKAGGISDSSRVTCPSKFFLRDLQLYAAAWEAPKARSEKRQDENVEAGRQWLAAGGAS
jgi:hypothetical protein